MKLAKNLEGDVVVEVEEGDFPKGTDAIWEGHPGKLGFNFRNNRYFSPEDIARHIDELVLIERSWHEYIELNAMAPRR